MTTEEIKIIKEEIVVRNLRPTLRRKIMEFRNTVSVSSINRALDTKNFETAAPLRKRVIAEAKALLLEHGVQI